MCGICGIIRFDARPVEANALERACVRLRHRGPDDWGVWIDSDAGEIVGLGATRLAILDPSPAGHQPMHREGGRFHLVYNGDIYNFREIRRELSAAGDPFVTDGDTEVVLAACVRWGVDAFTRFNGMWALAFYDSRTRSGFLSRDRFGVKPLFYCVDGRGLRFASELPALTELGDWDRSIDPRAVVQHLQYGYIAHPATIYRGARRLPPGCFLKFNHSQAASPLCHYELHARATQPASMDYATACTRLRRRLADAVVCRRVSDVPIGAFLSGGVDSSIVALHLAAATGRPVRTFSIGFADEPGYDETRFARLAAERIGTEHHEWVLTRRDLLDAVPQVLDHLGEPVGDSSILPTALLAQYARRFVTVALSGDGGDELFGGYWRYQAHESMATYERVPAFVRRGLVEPVLAVLSASKSSGRGNRVRQFRKLLRARGGEDALARHVAWSRILAPEAESLYLDHDLPLALDREMTELARRETANMNGTDPLNRVMAFDVQHQLPADMLQKVDLASMMHSLEVRVPFLDPTVVELSMAMPSRYKVDRGQRKRVLIDAYRGHLPDAILERSKQGFEAPVGEFLRGPMRDLFHGIVTRDVVESFGSLSYPAVQTIYQEHLDRRAEHADLLFALLSLCWWRRRAL